MRKGAELSLDAFVRNQFYASTILRFASYFGGRMSLGKP